MQKSQKLLTFRQTTSIKLECEIDLDLLFDTCRERKRFEEKWDGFLESNPPNPKIFAKTGNRLYYSAEQLIPEKRDKRPPFLCSSAILPANPLQTACSFPLKEMEPNTAFGKAFSGLPEFSSYHMTKTSRLKS
jgi:hypothetical protein